MDVGDSLRQARESRHLSIDDIARATRLNARALADIEAGLFQRLPGGFYTRSMLRAFAREVGLDPERTVAAYLTEYEHDAPVSVQSAAVPVEQRSELAAQLASGVQWIAHAIDPTWYIAAAAVLGLWMVYLSSGAREPIATNQVAIDSPGTPSDSSVRRDDDVQPVGMTGLPAGAAPTGTSDEALRVELKATDRCWVAATADGQRVVYRVLLPGEIETVTATDLLVLRIGNPAALAIMLNGEPARALGDGREPVTVRVTPRTYRDLTMQ